MLTGILEDIATRSAFSDLDAWARWIIVEICDTAGPGCYSTCIPDELTIGCRRGVRKAAVVEPVVDRQRRSC